MIQNVVLDIGNVLVNYYPHDYIRQFTTDEAVVQRLHDRIFLSDAWKAGDAGTMTRQETVAALCAQYPDDAAAIRRVMDRCDEMLTAVEDNTALLRDLKQAGFSLYYLSNTNPSAFEYMSATHAFFRYMDGGIASYKVKCLKPDPIIFEKFLQTYHKTPESCVFVDDTAVNVQSAQSLGFHTVLLRRPEELRDELLAFDDIRQKLGVVQV